MNMATELTTRRVFIRNHVDKLTGHVLCPDCGADMLQWNGGDTRKGRSCKCLVCGSNGYRCWLGVGGEIFTWHTTAHGERLAFERQKARDYAEDRQAQTAPF